MSLVIDEEDIIRAISWHDNPHKLVVMETFPLVFPIEELSNPAEETSKVRPAHLICVTTERAASHPGPPLAKFPLHSQPYSPYQSSPGIQQMRHQESAPIIPEAAPQGSQAGA